MKRVEISAIHLILTLFLIQGCAVVRKAEKPGQKEITSLWIKKYELRDCSEERMLGKAGVRYLKDSVILVTMRNRSGMEGARIYVYKDSVFAFNRIKKVYFAGKIPAGISEEEKRGKDNGLLRKGKQKKYFEYDLGNGTRITIYVGKYSEIARKTYIPEEMTVKILYEKRIYCYRFKNPEIKINEKISVRRIMPGTRYKRVAKADEVL